MKFVDRPNTHQSMSLDRLPCILNAKKTEDGCRCRYKDSLGQRGREGERGREREGEGKGERERDIYLYLDILYIVICIYTSP